MKVGIIDNELIQEALKVIIRESLDIDVSKALPEEASDIIASDEQDTKTAPRVEDFIKLLKNLEVHDAADATKPEQDAEDVQKALLEMLTGIDEDIDETIEKLEEEAEPELIHSLHLPTNIYKKDGYVYIQMVVPGYNEDQVSVEISEDSGCHILTAIGTPVPRIEIDEAVVQDYVLDGFTSTVEISREIAGGTFEVAMKNGVLTIKAKPLKKFNTVKEIF